MATKRCPRCDGKGFIELGIGLARRPCPECGGRGNVLVVGIEPDPTEEFITATKDSWAEIIAEPQPEPVPELESDYGKFVLPSQRDNTGTGKPDRSGKGKAAGNRQRKGKKAKAGVRKRA